ncbi:MAG: nucleotidyl transferase AbiEii/AbiGii toxin family protein, partial [Pirellula sp.]
LPYLETVATESIGSAVATRFEYIIDPATQSPVILFHYPSTQPFGFDYIKRYVKLEFGSLTDQQPTGHHPIRPWIADELPNAFEDWGCDVVALELDRTFWEKATILHAEYHRPANKATPDRFSRHYADTAAL